MNATLPTTLKFWAAFPSRHPRADDMHGGTHRVIVLPMGALAAPGKCGWWGTEPFFFSDVDPGRLGSRREWNQGHVAAIAATISTAHHPATTRHGSTACDGGSFGVDGWDGDGETQALPRPPKLLGRSRRSSSARRIGYRSSSGASQQRYAPWCLFHDPPVPLSPICRAWKEDESGSFADPLR